ncbi:MAG: hypothetical protein MK095_00645 [Phycisphaerales bacterium]|nr:hypothetical protein [Phycisphaerales bacterium]
MFPRKLVLLEHVSPDQPVHVDWMIAKDHGGHAPLETYRITMRLDAMKSGGSQILEPLADHRPRYLRCDGPLGGGRGHVRRLATGRAWSGHDQNALIVQWKTGPAAGRLQQVRIDTGSHGDVQVHCEAWDGPWR